jgi:hypothetical protein
MVARVKDDLDGEISNLTGHEMSAVTLGYNGKIVELDLGEGNRTRLEEAIAEFMAAGRPVPEHHTAQPVKGTGLDVWEIGRRLRAYAQEHGFEVPTKGGDGQGNATSYYYSSELRLAFCRDTGIPLQALPGGKSWVKAHRNQAAQHAS